MGVGEKVRYYFPQSEKREKTFVTGTIDFIDGDRIILLCDDDSWLIISVQDISRLHVIKESRKKVTAQN